MSNNPYKVLVTSAHATAALAVTRSLGEKGVRVICADDNKTAKTFYSKYCKDKFIYPSPEERPDEFINFLADNVRKNHYDVLFPITDPDVYLITKHLDEFSPYVKVAMNDHLTCMKVLDKSQTLKIATEIDVPVPETIFIDDINELADISEILKYPVIIKPRQSATLISNKIVRGSTIRIASQEELISSYKKLHKQIPYPIIQEYITGKEAGIFLLLNNGELKALFSHRRIRSADPLGGASSLRESIEINTVMKEYALKMLKAINWDGVAMVEFKIDSRDNIPKLMEINGRFWQSLPLAIASGVDFPFLLFKTVLGEDVEPVLDYKKGVRCRYLYGDLIHLFTVMCHRDSRFEYPKRIPTLLNFMKFYEKDLVYDDIFVDDPMLTLKTFTDIFTLPKAYFQKKCGWS